MSPKRIARYVAAYVLWAVSIGLGALILYLAREVLLLTMVVSSTAGEPTARELFYQSYRVAAASHWTMLFLGVFLIIMLVAFEHYYRTGASERILWRRFFLVTWIQGALLLVLHLIIVLLRSSFIPVSTGVILLLAAEAVITGVFLLLWQRSRRVPSNLRV
jgi:hypothetical protein